MGISAKDVLAQDPELLRRELYQKEMQQLNPSGDVFGTIGALIGRGASNVSQGRGFFDVADPSLRRVARMNSYQQEAMQAGAGDPVKTLEVLGTRLTSDPELAPLAMQVQEQLLQFKEKAAQQRRAGLQEQKAEADIRKAELSAAQEDQLRKELTALGPNATEDQIMSVVTKYGTPDKILSALAAKQSRQAALAQSRELAEQRLELQRQNVEARKQNQGLSLTPAQKRTDALFAKEYNDYVVGGGASTVDKSLFDLDKAIDILEKNPSVTGKVVGAVNTLGDTALAAAYPKAAEAKDLVGGVAQSNLRAVLGGQFAAKEGEALLARAYNPGAPVSDNLQRLKSLRQQIQAAKDAKEQSINYYEEKGTLANFKRGSSKSTDTPKTTDSGAGQPPAGVDPAVWSVMTPAERSLWEKK